MKILDVDSLNKTFLLHILNQKVIPALGDISFSLEEAEILGLTGRSGSGKSSLMKCIYRTYAPSSGQMWFESGQFGRVDLTRATDHEVILIRRNEMNYCSQFLQVIPRVTALDVVAEPLVYNGTDAEEARGRAAALFEELALPTELWNAFPATFSGGEQQRVNVARALIRPPRLLLIDEPTASLDEVTRARVIGLIHRIREGGTAVILISHDSFTHEQLSDRRLFLDGGRLAPLDAPAVGTTTH